MYVKVKSGGSSYDVLIPSDYMIEKMSKKACCRNLISQNTKFYKHITNVPGPCI
jgi:spermidine/putrescine transport system substrate-binding protein